MNNTYIGEPVAFAKTNTSTIVAECNGVKRTFVISSEVDPIAPPKNDCTSIVTSHINKKIQPKLLTREMLTSDTNAILEHNLANINSSIIKSANRSDYVKNTMIYSVNKPLFPVNSTSINYSGFPTFNSPSNNQWNIFLPPTSALLNIDFLKPCENSYQNVYNLFTTNSNLNFQQNLSFNSRCKLTPSNTLSSTQLPFNGNLNSGFISMPNLSTNSILTNFNSTLIPSALNLSNLNQPINNFLPNLNAALLPQTYKINNLTPNISIRSPPLAPAYNSTKFLPNLCIQNNPMKSADHCYKIPLLNQNNFSNFLVNQTPHSLSSQHKNNILTLPTLNKFIPIRPLNISSSEKTSSAFGAIPSLNRAVNTSPVQLNLPVSSTTVNNEPKEKAVLKVSQPASPHLNLWIQNLNDIDERSLQLDSLFDDIDNVLDSDNEIENHKKSSRPQSIIESVKEPYISRPQSSIESVKEKLATTVVDVSMASISAFSRPPPSVSCLIAMKGSRTQKKPKSNDSKKKRKILKSDEDDSDSWKPDDDECDVDSLADDIYPFVSSGDSLSDDSSWVSEDSITIGKKKKVPTATLR